MLFYGNSYFNSLNSCAESVSFWGKFQVCTFLENGKDEPSFSLSLSAVFNFSIALLQYLLRKGTDPQSCLHNLMDPPLVSP